MGSRGCHEWEEQEHPAQHKYRVAEALSLETLILTEAGLGPGQDMPLVPSSCQSSAI